MLAPRVDQPRRRRRCSTRRRLLDIALLERVGTIREEQLRAPAGRSARGGVAHSVSRWSTWAEANRMLYLGTVAPGEDITDPDVRRAVAELRDCVVALLVAFHADIAQDSPQLRYALECWTGRTARRRATGCG